MKEQIIYKAGCWDCKRSQEDPNEQYICPKAQRHQEDYEKFEYKFEFLN